jgi:hypothetical protein
MHPASQIVHVMTEDRIREAEAARHARAMRQPQQPEKPRRRRRLRALAGRIAYSTSR